MNIANNSTRFDQSTLEAIAKALGHTEHGLTNSQIKRLLEACEMEDSNPSNSKWLRIYNAFDANQKERDDREGVLGFVRSAMNPARYVEYAAQFEPLRAKVNKALAFAGLAADEKGELISASRVHTLPEAVRRANELRADLEQRKLHPDVIEFCRPELLVDDYFHAVLEACKSIAEKIKNKTGSSSDGNRLVMETLTGDQPMLAINDLQSPSERNEQKGFVDLLTGIFRMFRNVAAHEPQIHWHMDKDDAADLLSVASLIHRRLDDARLNTNP